MQTFSDMALQVGRKVQNETNAASTIIKSFINDAYETVWRSRLWGEICVWNRAITTTAGSADLVLPKDVGVILCLNDQANVEMVNGLDGVQMTRGNLSTLATSGNAVRYQKAGSVGAAAQPASASALSIVSSDSGDTTQAVVVWGTDAVGNRFSESNTLNGVSAVTTTATFTTVERVTKGDNTTGTVTVTAGAVTIGTLAPTESASQYQRIRIGMVPASASTLYISYKRRFWPLENDADVAEIDCGQALILYGTAAWWDRMRQFSKAAMTRQEANQALAAVVNERKIQGDEVTTSMPLIERQTIDLPVGY